VNTRPRVASHRILLLGATGATGRHLVRQALELGHTVTAVSRHPDTQSPQRAGLVTRQLDVTRDEAGLVELLPDHDVVLSTVGRGLKLRSHDLIRQTDPLIVRAMEWAGPTRLVALSAFGVGQTYAQAPLRLKLVFRTLFRDLYRDKEAGERAIRSSRLEWTLLYPVALNNKTGTGQFVIGPRLPPGPFRSLPRADLARAMLSVMDDRSTSRQDLVVAPGNTKARKP
jgi:uncharacterized protein YbjT (DUF2867 family)